MNQSAAQPPAGWYPDPAGSGDERYWDGGTWSQVTRPAGGMNVPPGAGAAGPQYVTHSQGSAPGYTTYGPQYGQVTPVLAGWWWRVLASIIDSLVFIVPLSIIQAMVVNPALPEFERWLTDIILAAERGVTDIPPFPDAIVSAMITYSLISAVLWIVYRTLMVGRFGATLGQMATSLKVVRDSDTGLGLIGWGPSAIRAVLAVVIQNVPLLGLVNVLMPLFTRKKQTFHDMAAKTVVVRTK